MATLHIVFSPEALAAALAAMADGDELALLHRAATRGAASVPAAGRVHVLEGDAGAAALVALCVRHARSVSWR